MKKFYLFVLFVSLIKISFSAPVITATCNGPWNATSTWNLNRVPKVGDTIVIPSGKTIIINDDRNFNGFIYLKVYGLLNFQNNNSTLSIDAPSIIVVFSGGQIAGGGSPSQKIKYANSTIFEGDDLAISGPQIASSTSSGFNAFSSSPLPVKFVGFTLTHKSNDVLVQWSTAEEISANMYEVERSFDGNNWASVAYVAARGNSSGTSNYSFTDKTLQAKIAYYRIREIDIDGKTSFTSIRSIRTDVIAAASDIKIASVQNKVLLQFPQQIKGSLMVRFVTINGQVMDQQSINNPVGQVVINSKVTGNYIISISNGENINTAKQVIL